MSEDEDHEAIIALIHANRIAMWTQNYELYQQCFVHEPYATRWGWWRRGGPFLRYGWEDISARVREQFKDPSLNIASNAYETRLENLNLRIGVDMAWATFDQLYPPTMLQGEVGLGRTREARVFEKHDGKWRIAFLGFLEAKSVRSDAVMLRLARDGTVLWQSPAVAEALAASDDLVIRNERLRLRDSRLDKKLQIAIGWAAGIDDAVMSRHGAVPILIERGEGEPTQICWVIGEGGMIFFSLDHAGLSQQRLDMAAIIYELSPMQKQLAGHVAQGLSLPEIAATMGISANTARTHLQRIFEKTGVHNQTALVRVLLSAASPL